MKKKKREGNHGSKFGNMDMGKKWWHVSAVYKELQDKKCISMKYQVEQGNVT